MLPALTSAFAEIEHAVEHAEGRLGEALTVTVAPVFAAKWLVPRLRSFYEANPGLQLRIEALTAIVDFDFSDVDAGVGKGPWPRTHAERLAELSLFPVSCPAVAENLESVKDLARIPVIVDHGSLGRWPFWLAAVGHPEIKLAPGPTFSDAGLCLEGCDRGARGRAGLANARGGRAEGGPRRRTLSGPRRDGGFLLARLEREARAERQRQAVRRLAQGGASG